MIKLYNTLTRQVDPLPNDHPLKMFVCGPTVYDYIHIGNARTFVFFDALAKYIRFRGYTLHYIQNITDIEDRIIVRAEKNNEDWKVLADRFTNEFLQDTRSLGITAVNKYARATDYIAAIIKQIATLIEKGYGYEITDGIYFDLKKFKDYGKLSGRTTLAEDDGVSRIDENPEKLNSGDFCLWKKSKPGEPTWPSPWGDGRPGWHIEDTAITESIFGAQYDLHGGAQDLMFPHHEAEIAQQEAASGKIPFVQHWIHAGFLVNKDEKMSKSKGNFSTVHELTRDYDTETLRLLLLSGHYRSPLAMSESALKQAEAGINRIAEFIERLRFFEESTPFAHKHDSEIKTKFEELENKILEALDNDFNAPAALGFLFESIRLGNQYIDAGEIDLHSVKRILSIFDVFQNVFGIVSLKQKVIIPEGVKTIVTERQKARENKNFDQADKFRQDIESAGYSVDDTEYGTLVKPLKKTSQN